MRRIWPVVLAIVLILSINVGSAMALTTKRLWQASVGANGANGRVSLRAYTNTTGLLTLRLKSMRPNASYTLEIRAGTCSSLGAVRASFVRATSTSTGLISTSRNVSGTKMSSIWKVARTGRDRLPHGQRHPCALREPHVPGRHAHRRRDPRHRPGDHQGPDGLSAVPGRDVHAGSCSAPRARRHVDLRPRRTGMFLPLLTKSRINNGASLIGRRVKVYTSDSKVSTYQIVSVRRHVTIDPVGVRGHVGAPLDVHVRGPQFELSEAHRDRQATVDGRDELRRVTSEGSPGRLLSAPRERLGL